PALTHVVIVGGDSDYVPLAQRCKRLGRYVIGIGVAGSTARSLAAACDEFESYEMLPGVDRPDPTQKARSQKSRSPSSAEGRARSSDAPDASGRAARGTGAGADGTEKAAEADGNTSAADRPETEPDET